MIVRFDFECDRKTIANIDDACVFFSSSNENARRFGRKPFQQRPRVFVRAMLAPHDRKNTEFSNVGLASENTFNALVFLESETVFLDNLRGNGRLHGFLITQGGQLKGFACFLLKSVNETLKNETTVRRTKQRFTGAFRMRH